MPKLKREHSDTCDAEVDHDHDCATASELARLRAFAEIVREEFPCTLESVTAEDHVQAMEGAR